MPVKPTTAAEFGFGDFAVYVAGGGIPEGDYALEHIVQYEQETENYKPTVPRLGVMLIAHPMDGGEARTKFLSMGSTIHESFAPNENGTGIVPRAGGKGATTLSQSTNWAYYLKSLYDSGLPQGVFVNDISVLNGTHVHLSVMNEPEERKGFKKPAASAEVEQTEKPRRPGTIPIVTEIKEDGKPWEGSGGIPEAGEKKPAPKAAAPAGKPNGSVAKFKAPAKVAPAAPAEMSDEELMDAALQGVTSVLEKNANGCMKVALRTGAFKAVSGAHGDAVANKVISTFFGSDDELNGLIQQLGYELQGQKVVVQG